MNKSQWASASAACVIAAVLAAPPAFAQTQPQGIAGTPGSAAASAQPAPATAGSLTQDAGLADIIVTAQRRSENIQNVPITILAVPGDTLVKAGVNGIASLQQVSPNLTYTESVAGSHASIRGIGSFLNGPGAEDPVAVYFDGVYIGSNVGNFYPFMAVARTEVLSGPQGTLFGRNTTGGVINIVSRDPSYELGGEAQIGYGSYDTVQGSAYVTGGLTDTLAVDAAGSFLHQGTGYGVNLFDGSQVGRTSRNTSLRASLLWTPTSRTQVRLSGGYNDYASSAFGFHAFDGQSNGMTVPAGGPQDVNINTPPIGTVKSHYVTLRVNQDLGFASLVSISGYRNIRSFSLADLDNGPVATFAVANTTTHRQFSQELQLVSPTGRPFEWVLGAYYYNADAAFAPNQTMALFPPFLPLGLDTTNVYNTVSTRAFALFGQSKIALGSKTNLTLGARYSWEKRSTDGYETDQNNLTPGPITTIPRTQRSVDFGDPTWRIALDHHLTPDVLVYASYNRGFKSGGFNAQDPTATAYKPERVDAYEAGFKLNLLNRRLRFNASGFYYDYTNLQVQSFTGGNLVVENAAAAKIYGAEAQVTALLASHFTVDGSVAYTDGKYTSYPGATCYNYAPGGSPTQSPCDATNRPLLAAPKWVFSVTPRYEYEWGDRSKIAANVSFYHNSGQYFEFNQNPAVLNQGPWDNINASVDYTLPGGVFTIGAWGNNLGNAQVLNSMVVFGLALPFAGPGIGVNYRPPRTYGVRLSAKF